MGKKKKEPELKKHLERKEEKRGEENVLAEKVLLARESTGLSLSKAAENLGFNNYQTLANIEKGVRKINANELIDMARLYGRSLAYFFEPDISLDPQPLWRKTTDIDVRDVQRQFRTFLENYSTLENLLGLERRWKDIQKNYDRRDFSKQGFRLAKKLGGDYCASLNLGSRPASNLLNVLESDLRIKILHLKLENGISGGSVVDDKLGVGILINSKDVPWRRNFDLAHELFHIVTWNVFSHEEVGDGTGAEKTVPEQYADTFAASLLLPEKQFWGALKDITIDGHIRLVNIIELAKDFGVSTEAVLWRLVNLNVLRKEKVSEIIDNPERRSVDRAMRRPLYSQLTPSKFPERYVSLACRCLIDGKISRGTFAEYLEIDRAEVDSFLKKQGFVEENYEEIAAA